MNIPLVEKAFLEPKHQQYIQVSKNEALKLEPIDVNIVDELERTGICVSSLETLGIPNTANFLEAAEKLCAELAETVTLPVSKGTSARLHKLER